MRCALKILLPIVAALLCIAGPSQAQHCTAGCPRSLPTTVVPKVDSTYVYALEAKTVLTPRDTQKVTIKADAEVGIQSVCEAVLKLKNVVIEGVPDGADLAAQVAINPTSFGYFNGKIGGFCPTKDEEEWVVNIKKAIVSALQLSSTGEESDDVVEEDFSGKCLTSFQRIEKTDSGLVVEKKKNLNRCKDRRVDLRQTPDQALGQLKELIRQYAHPMDSKLLCKLTLKDQVVSEVDCEESHTLVYRQDKPLHVSNIKLSLKDTKAGIATDLAAREFDKQEIFFNHDHKHKHTSTEADIVETLKKLCQEVSGKLAHIEASSTFEDLVSKLRYAADDVVSSVDEAAKSGSICPAANKRLRELFLDASAFAASDGSIKALVNAHNNNELSISRATAAFTVVALKAAPKEDTIQALVPLINSDKTTRPLLLGLSILTRRYCQKTNDCATNAAVKEARDAFVTRIGKTENKQEKITLIKALENLNTNKENNENVVKLLDELINSESANGGVRLAAVNALPDEESINEQLKSIVLKESNPNDVRIAAFRKLVKNKGVKNIDELVGVQEHCVKNYILTFVKNVKKSKNAARRSLLPDDVNVTEEPNTKFGVTKNVAYEYGPVTVDFDVIYPKDSNVTQAINARVSRSVDDKYVEVVELGLRHEGLDKNVANILNLISRKISPSEFGFEAVRHLSALIKKIKSKDPNFNSLQVSVKVNGKNLAFTDVFEDIHTLADLLKKRFEKVVADKGVDRTIGGVLIDTKLLVPTISGIPLIYKLNDNFVIQINGQVTGDSKKRNIVLNRSLIAAIQGSMKLKLKDNKMGYEYDAKLAVTPLLDLDVEKNDKSVVLRVNIKDIDRHTFLKFKQSLREKRSGAKDENEIENELAPEPRSDDCFTPLILNFCRKASQVKGLKIPNVEYYATKPDNGITALQLELKLDDSKEDRKVFSGSYKAVNSAQDTEHSVEVDISYPANAQKEVKIMLKSPTNKLETKFSLNLDKSRNLDLKLNFPHLIDLNVKGKFDLVKETNTNNNEIMVDYKFPDDPTLHTLKFKNSLSVNLKRSSKDKVASLDYTSEMISSRRPILNHRTLVSFKYRPLKTNEIVLDLTYGQNFDRKLTFSRISKSEVQEMKPFTMTSDTNLKIVSSELDVNYDIKSDLKLLSEKGLPKEFDMNIKGKDLSKRAAETGNTDIDGKIEYRNKGPQIDQKINANLKIWGKDMAYESELKHVEGQKYEGKITIQTEKDKKIFITHKEEVSKPTKDISVKFDADVSYSHKPDKKNYNFELKKMNKVYTVKGNVKKNGEVIFNNDLTLEQNGKLKLLLQRGPRSYDVDVDNVFRAKAISVIFKVKDRVYDIKIDRDPFRYLNLKVNGNDQAYIKTLDAHLSILDPMFAHLLTKANTKVDFTFDLLDSNKKATLMIDSPKYNFKHDGTSELSIINPRLLLKSSTKKDDREFKLTADIARKGSLIAFERVTPERTSKVKYSRNGDKVNVDIDTTNVQGSIEGDRKSGKIHLKNTENNYELESTYKCENGKFLIQSTTSNNAKLEALISRNEPSSFVFESPKINTHLKLDVSKPRKTLEFDFDNPLYQRKSSGEFERGVMYRYSSQSKIKSSSKEHKIEINGVPHKEMNVDIDLTDFKFKITKPPSGDKVKFEYTLNDYTESEEYDFNPHRSNLVNWILAIRKYIRSFLVD